MTLSAAEPPKRPGRAHEAGDEDADALDRQQRRIDLHLVGVGALDLLLDDPLQVAGAGAGDADRPEVRDEEVAGGIDDAERLQLQGAPDRAR